MFDSIAIEQKLVANQEKRASLLRRARKRVFLCVHFFLVPFIEFCCFCTLCKLRKNGSRRLLDVASRMGRLLFRSRKALPAYAFEVRKPKKGPNFIFSRFRWLKDPIFARKFYTSVLDQLAVKCQRQLYAGVTFNKTPSICMYLNLDNSNGIATHLNDLLVNCVPPNNKNIFFAVLIYEKNDEEKMLGKVFQMFPV